MSMDLYAHVYWGIQIDKDQMDSILSGGSSGAVEEAELSSSLLQRARYDPESNTLMLELSSGEWHRYSDVPAKVFRGLVKASSAGAYFNRHIKDQYSAEPLSPDEEEAGPDSVEALADREGINILGYCEGRDYFSSDPDGYLVGFEAASIWGFGPQDFHPSDFQVARDWRRKLQKFCDKYGIAEQEPRWLLYLELSN